MTRGVPGSIAPHGTVARYCAGCREGCCRDAKARHERARRLAAIEGRPRLLDSTGTVRRLQALAVAGHSLTGLAIDLGRHEQFFRHMLTRYRHGGMVTPEMAQLVRDLFTRLCMTPGPSRLAAALAAAKGWAPALAWDDIDDPAEIPRLTAPPVPDAVDEIAIERAVQRGCAPSDLTPSERALVTARLARRGWSDPEIGEHLGVSSRTVLRTRHAAHIESRWSA